MAVDHLDASRQLEQHLDAIYCPLRAQDQRRLDLGSFERPLGVHGEDDLDAGVSCSRPDGEEERERGCDDRELGSPQRERSDQPQRRESRISDESRVSRSGHERGRPGVLRRRRRHAVEHLADDVLGGDPLHPQLGAQHEAMCERGNGDGLHVVRKHEVAALQRGAAARELEESEASARARTDRGALRRPRRGDDVDAVLADADRDMNALDRLLHRDQGRAVDHGRSSTSSDARSMRRVSTSTSPSRLG